MSESKKDGLLLVALWTLLLGLAAFRPLALPDEGRYAEVGRWMLLSGDGLASRLNGIPFFHKPPLLYWLEALSMAVFGVNAWAARLVPALHAGVMLLTVYLTARRLSSGLVARHAALMLGTSLSFLLAGQYVNHDMLVAAWIGVAIWAFALAFLQEGRPDPLLARLGFVACALGVLSKGLIGLALPGLVLLVWLVWTRQWRKILQLPWVSGLALFAGIAVPWFVLVEQHYPGALGYLVGVQHFQRFTGKTFNNPHPWWFYLPVLAGLFFPWIFGIFGQLKQAPTPMSSPHAVPRTVWQLCWIWIVAIVGFFSIPNSKIVGYVLPVLPPLALLAALGWQRWLGRGRHGGRVLAGLALLALVTAVGLNVVAGRYTEARNARDIALELACRSRPSDRIYVLGGYPYDVPFYARTRQAMVVIQDWPELRRSAGDNWRRELFEGARFDAQAGQVLQTADVLPDAAAQPGHWLLAPRDFEAEVDAEGLEGKWPQGWVFVAKGRAWNLYRSTPERPEPAEQERLPGCDHQRNAQGPQ